MRRSGRRLSGGRRRAEQRTRGETSGEADAVLGKEQCEGTIKRKKMRAKRAPREKRRREAKRVAWAGR